MAKVLEPGSALRLQLEGRWERIEQAQERYAALTQVLAPSGWRRLLRLQPRLPAEIQEQEPALDEVLEYVERRAGLERWPASHPGPASLRAIRAQRTRLEALARKRLAQVSPEREGTSFLGRLEQLGALAAAPVPQPPLETEPVLLEGDTWLAPGQFWLTPERLVWYPWWGEPEQVALNTMDPWRISLLPGGLGVRVEGARRLRFASPFLARPLVSLLQRYRLLPPGPRIQLQKVMIRRAFRDNSASGRKADEQWGVSVFRPGYLAFLPERRLSLLDRVLRFVGVPSRREPVELRRLERLLDHLRELPIDDFDACVAEIARARGGGLWMASGVRRVVSPLGQGLRFRAGGEMVVVPRDSAKDVVLDQLLSQEWPYGDPQLAITRHPSWWARHARALALVGAGMFLQFSPLAGIPLPPTGTFPVFHLIGVVLTVLGWMRYMKVKGMPPLLGLLGVVSCPGWIILLALPDKNKPPKDS